MCIVVPGGWIVVSPEINADRKIAPNTDLVLRSKNSVNNEVAQEDFEVINSGESPDKYFPLSQLTVGSSNPASDIDATRREVGTFASYTVFFNNIWRW